MVCNTATEMEDKLKDSTVQKISVNYAPISRHISEDAIGHGAEQHYPLTL